MILNFMSYLIRTASISFSMRALFNMLLFLLLTAFLAITGGKQTSIPVPNVVGQTQAVASAAITDAGLAVGPITLQHSTAISSGSVISQTPAPGTSVRRGSAVALTVSEGPESVTVPNVVGLSEIAATATISGTGLNASTLIQQCSDTVAAGLVITQTPEAGQQVSSGSSLALIISTGPCNVTVPDVAGMTQAEASTAITGAGLVVGTVTQEYSSTVPLGSVISQSPVSLSSVNPGSAVALIISQGPATVTVPNVVGLSERTATATISGTGLRFGTLTQQCSNTVASGLVISQIPEAGQQAFPGSSVALIMSTGPCNLTVPDVVGMALSAAQSVTTDAGLVVGTIRQEYSSTVAPGSVISQSPTSGTSVSPGSTVALIVSAGPEPVIIVPDVVGMTQSDASTAITNALLALGAVTQIYNSTVPVGEVVSQDPVAGASVLPGTSVSLDISKGPEPGAVQTMMLPGDVPLEMVWIPGGTFMMGSPDTELDRYTDEGPQHSVTLGGYWMAKFELTKHQWTAVMGTTPWSGRSYVLADLDSPAVYVSWNDAQLFMTAVNNYTGLAFRLPSEAEWEYACRAGTTTRFYWGDDLSYTAIGDYAWYSYNAYNVVGQQYAHVVGGKTANSFGLYDMSGNVWEWCQDWYGAYGAGAQTNPTGPATGSYRVLRGGGWTYIDFNCRLASRDYFTPSSTLDLYGFRVVMSVPIPVAVTSLQINSGASSTAYRSVTLNNTCTGSPTEYMASELSDFSDAAWQPYATAPSFTLSSGDGTKTVWFKVRDASRESTAISDTITLNEVTTETVMLPGDVPLEMVWIPGGTFMMGSPDTELDRWSNEGPQHSVTLSGYWMGKYELTKRQWTAVMGTTPWSGQSYVLADLDSPAVYVSWNDAQSFMTTVNLHITTTGQGAATMRLPSESEWEYACRAGTTTRFYWGDDLSYTAIGDYAWYWGNCSSEMYAHVVGTAGVTGHPNAFGLYDMSGNVWEWCQDWYHHSDYTGAPTDGSAWELPTGSYRVLRGGSWYYYPSACRSANRSYYSPPDSTNYSRGLRVVMSVLPVAVTSLAIKSGASSTAYRTVTLNNTCTGSPTEYMASELSDFSDASWQPYATAPSLTLSSGDGTKTVWFKVKNALGESTAISDTIILNETVENVLFHTAITSPCPNGNNTLSDSYTVNVPNATIPYPAFSLVGANEPPPSIDNPVTSWPAVGMYDFCAVADNVACSLEAFAGVSQEIGALSSLYLCSTDLNGPVNPNPPSGGSPYTPNGIPDGQFELQLIAGVLNDPTNPHYTEVTNAFRANFQYFKVLLTTSFLSVSINGNPTDLRPAMGMLAPHLSGSLAALWAAYATLGDADTYAMLDVMMVEMSYLGFVPQPGGIASVTVGVPAMGPEGDADGDGLTNRQEYDLHNAEGPEATVAAQLGH